MFRDVKIIKEAVKAAKKKKEKPLDPNEEARKRNGLPKHHTVGHSVHAGLAVKGGAGYRGKVVKVDNTHTYIDIGNKRTVKAPHRLVSAHEEVMHREETVVEANSPTQAKAKLDKHASDLSNRLDKGDNSNKTKRVAQAVKAAYNIARKDPSRKVTGSIVNPSDETVKKSQKNLSDFNKKVSADAYIKGDSEKAKRYMGHAKHYAKEETAWDSDAKKEREVSHYNIVSRSKGSVVGKAQTMKSARKVRDRHDNNYGSYNHSIQPVWKEETNSEERMKVSNIGRPNDPPVNSKGSVLHRTLQIKHKIIDEG